MSILAGPTADLQHVAAIPNLKNTPLLIVTVFGVRIDWVHCWFKTAVRITCNSAPNIPRLSAINVDSSSI
jgi:hypothetical protein